MNIFLKLLPKALALLFLFMGIKERVYAQNVQTLCEVTVKGVRTERFMVGQKIKIIDSSDAAAFRFSQLNEFLQFQTPVVFRSNGVGQVASISMRGTSAMHTAVLWNGININSPSVGQLDFSSMPMIGIDQLSVQYGSAASCVGSDAVGGSLIIRSEPNRSIHKPQFFVAARADNSNQINGQIGLRFNQKLSDSWAFAGKTILYGNDFGSSLTKKVQQKAFDSNLYAENIDNQQVGFMQDVFLMKKNGDGLSINLWFSGNDNSTSIRPEIQPTNEILKENLISNSNRVVAAYQLGKTLFRTGFIRDFTAFTPSNGIIPAETTIDRYIGRVEHDLSWIKSCDRGLNLKLGSEMVYYHALVDGYGSELKNEMRVDFYALLRYQQNARLSTSLNFRQALVEGYDPPFTPSLGIDYQVIKNNNFQLLAQLSSGLSYRVPTLNERFWIDLGNADIKPERGLNNEIGLRLKHSNWQTGASVYRNLIDNWAYWNPERRYRVENLQQVLAKGIEFDFSHNFEINKFKIQNTVNYALNDVSQNKEYGQYTATIVGKQLVYVPKHIVGASHKVSVNNLQLILQQQFNSERYITFDHSGAALQAFYLLNCNFNYQFKKLNVAFTVNNVTDRAFATIRRTLMPTRNFGINIVFRP